MATFFCWMFTQLPYLIAVDQVIAIKLRGMLMTINSERCAQVSKCSEWARLRNVGKVGKGDRIQAGAREGAWYSKEVCGSSGPVG